MLIMFSQLRKRGKSISQRDAGDGEHVRRLAGIEAEALRVAPTATAARCVSSIPKRCSIRARPEPGLPTKANVAHTKSRDMNSVLECAFHLQKGDPKRLGGSHCVRGRDSHLHGRSL